LVLTAEDRRKRARLRRDPEWLELVEANERRPWKLASFFLEDRNRTSKVAPVDEHGLALASQERLGSGRPFRVGNFHEVA